MQSQFFDFVASDLQELETRDVDQLFECLRDNLQEAGLDMTDSMDNDLYSEIERQVKAELRADKSAENKKGRRYDSK